MPSTFSPNLRVELQATGENSNTWGSKLNALFEQMEAAIAGMVTVSTTGGTTVLTTANGLPDQARAAILKITGVLTSHAFIQIPAVSKTYVVWNDTSGVFTVRIGVSSSGVTAEVPQGLDNRRAFSIVMSDGMNTYVAASNYASGLWWDPSNQVLSEEGVQDTLEDIDYELYDLQHRAGLLEIDVFNLWNRIGLLEGATAFCSVTTYANTTRAVFSYARNAAPPFMSQTFSVTKPGSTVIVLLSPSLSLTSAASSMYCECRIDGGAWQQRVQYYLVNVFGPAQPIFSVFSGLSVGMHTIEWRIGADSDTNTLSFVRNATDSDVSGVGPQLQSTVIIMEIK